MGPLSANSPYALEISLHVKRGKGREVAGFHLATLTPARGAARANTTPLGW